VNKLDRTRLLAILVIFFSIIYFYLNIFYPIIIPSFLRIGVTRKPINILLLGTDITFNYMTNKPMPNVDGRTDTIVLAHIDPIKSELNLLSVPRDTLVSIPKYGWQKINAAHVFGGNELTKSILTDLTGQKIDYFIEVKPTAVSRLVDLLGGVTLYVEKDMRYVDRAQNLNINLKQGWQKLSGAKAHEYIRFRHDPFGDIGRVGRTQKFLSAATAELGRPRNIVKAPFAVNAALQEIKTDLPITEIFRLLNWMRMLAAGAVHTTTVSGEVSSAAGVGSVWQVDKRGLQKNIEEFF